MTSAGTAIIFKPISVQTMWWVGLLMQWFELASSLIASFQSRGATLSPLNPISPALC